MITGATVLGTVLLVASPLLTLAQTTSTSIYGTSTTGTTSTTTRSTTTPGIPNTGAGGDAGTTMLILASSALLAIAGAAYLRQRFADSERA